MTRNNQQIEHFKDLQNSKNYQFKQVDKVQLSKNKFLYKYKQYYNRIPIWNSVVVTDQKDINQNSIIFAKFVKDIELDLESLKLVTSEALIREFIQRQVLLEIVNKIELLKKLEELYKKLKDEELMDMQKIGINEEITKFENKLKFIKSNLDFKNMDLELVIRQSENKVSRQVYMVDLLLDFTYDSKPKLQSAINTDEKPDPIKVQDNSFNLTEKEKEDLMQSFRDQNIYFPDRIYMAIDANESALIDMWHGPPDYKSKIIYKGEPGAVLEAYNIILDTITSIKKYKDVTKSKKNSLSQNELFAFLDTSKIPSLNNSIIDHARDFCFIDPPINNSGIMSQAYFDLLEDKQWGEDKLLEVLNISNKVFWSEGVSIDDAACSLRIITEMLDYDAQGLTNIFAKRGVRTNCLNQPMKLYLKSINYEPEEQPKIKKTATASTRLVNPDIDYTTIRELDYDYQFAYIGEIDVGDGFTRYQFKQYYKYLEVMNTNLVINKPSIGCLRISDNVAGNYYINIEAEVKNTDPGITALDAIKAAYKYKGLNNSSDAKHLETKLFISTYQKKLYLMYKVTIEIDAARKNVPSIYIDAHTGKILGES